MITFYCLSLYAAILALIAKASFDRTIARWEASGGPQGSLPVLHLFKGGSPAPPKPQRMPEMPPPPAAPPPIPPPPTQTAIAADQAALDARKQELQRKGINSTLLAGETGGANAQGKKSLLG